jgi:hypothetical protein
MWLVVRRKGGGEGGELHISAIGKNFERWRETWRAVSSDTIHFEKNVCIVKDSSALRACDEFEHSNFGQNFPGYSAHPRHCII